MKVGFIGLGIMGSRMAANLQKAGYDLIVHNRTKAKGDELVAASATWADTPAAVAPEADILITVLAEPNAVRQMALGQAGFLDQMQADTIWVDSSTVNPSFSQQMAAEATGRQLHFLDAPVLGTKGPAQKGELLFSVGGDEADVERCRPLFEVMGRQVIHIGGHGMGSSFKMLANLMLAEAMLSFAEAVSLGESLGIDRELLLDTLPGSAVAAPFLQAKAENIRATDFEAHFPLQWMNKDLQMVAQTAYEQGRSLAMANVAKEIYALAKQKGLAELDFSAIYRLLAE